MLPSMLFRGSSTAIHFPPSIDPPGSLDTECAFDGPPTRSLEDQEEERSHQKLGAAWDVV